MHLFHILNDTYYIFFLCGLLLMFSTYNFKGLFVAVFHMTFKSSFDTFTMFYFGFVTNLYLYLVCDKYEKKRKHKETKTRIQSFLLNDTLLKVSHVDPLLPSFLQEGRHRFWRRIFTARHH